MGAWQQGQHPDDPCHRAQRYLDGLDRLLPGRCVGFYVVGSTALGAWRLGRSDVDFVAVLDGQVDLRRLRANQVRSGIRTAAAAARHRHSPMAGTVNGDFITADDVPEPVSRITPLATAVGYRFVVGKSANPVDWHTLVHHGITLRGPSPVDAGFDPEPHTLVDWNRQNLATYWRTWAARARARRTPPAFRLEPRDQTAWGVLGAPRLLRTIRTGEVVSKEAAGEYALEVMDPEWHDLVAEALAYWRGEPPLLPRDPVTRACRTADFVDTIRSLAAE